MKISSEISVPLQFDLSYCSNFKGNYKLSSCIYHNGVDIKEGHFINFVLVEGIWYKINDKNCKILKNIQKINGSYIIIYEREDLVSEKTGIVNEHKNEINTTQDMNSNENKEKNDYKGKDEILNSKSKFFFGDTEDSSECYNNGAFENSNENDNEKEKDEKEIDDNEIYMNEKIWISISEFLGMENSSKSPINRNFSEIFECWSKIFSKICLSSLNLNSCIKKFGDNLSFENKFMLYLRDIKKNKNYNIHKDLLSEK